MEIENYALIKQNKISETDLKQSDLVLLKFFTSSKILDKILESQKGFYDKTCLGYTESNHKNFKNYLRKKPNRNMIWNAISANTMDIEIYSI